MRGFATRAIHHGYDPYQGAGSLTPPIYASSTFTFPTVEEGGRRFQGEEGWIYGRIGSPTTRLLETRMASLEGAEDALAASSGMGAITSLLWSLLKPGDVLITDKTLYGCTFAFFRDGLSAFGVEVRHVDLTRPELLEEALTPNVKVVYFETPANPNMRVIDIAAVAARAKASGALTIVDSTYMSPFLQNPIALGADCVVHSATKYLGGHGDLLAGVAVGPSEIIAKARGFGLKDMTGACLSAFDAHLVLRGLKTLQLRMERHSSSALRLAQILEDHPQVERVFYPGLPSDPGYEVHRRQAKAGGGMIALELRGGLEAGAQFLNQLRLFVRAVSLGDAESLAQHPATMTHATYSPEERRAHGISEGLVRLSVGLEDPEDLEEDLIQALDCLPAWRKEDARPA